MTRSSQRAPTTDSRTIEARFAPTGPPHHSSAEMHANPAHSDASTHRVKVLFVVSVDWYFCLHWLPLAVAIRDAGFDVSVTTEITSSMLRNRIQAAGVKVLPIRLSRQGLNPLSEVQSLREIFRVISVVQPDLVHAIAQKPVLYATFCARLGRVPVVVATLAGMGYLFTSRSLKARLLRPWVSAAYRMLLAAKRIQVIVQNPEDQEELRRDAGLVASLIRGAGVDLERFVPAPPPTGPVTIVLASRMLWDKGLGEFVEAARLLRQQMPSVRAVLIGSPDTGNPAAVPEAQLREWERQGAIEWWGHRDDMPVVLAQAHIVCLPSYREGLPTILIEAAAAGLPLVAADVPGCREVVREGENGCLVPPRNAVALAEALARLAADPALRAAYGRASRRLAEAEFGIGRVAEATLAIYDKLFAELSAAQAPTPAARR